MLTRPILPLCASASLSVPFARGRNESKWRHRTLTMLTHFPLRAGALVAESHDVRGCALASVTCNPDEFSHARGIFTTALRVRFITDPRTVRAFRQLFYDVAVSLSNLKRSKLEMQAPTLSVKHILRVYYYRYSILFYSRVVIFFYSLGCMRNLFDTGEIEEIRHSTSFFLSVQIRNAKKEPRFHRFIHRL